VGPAVAGRRIVSAARILILDDEAAILFALSDYLTLRGYRVDTAQDLADARELLGQERHELLIVDLRLGGTHNNEGLWLVSWARAMVPGIRIMVLTGYGSPETEVEAYRLGANVFLHEPRPLVEIERLTHELTWESAT
jgi:ActR/RegA family two-component response regulator